METTQPRFEQSPPPLMPQPKRPRKDAEQDFDATLGSLVNYYATLPPGALEAEIQDSPTPVESDDLRSTGNVEVAAAPRPRRVWAWVLGGAGSMILGGVVTFALIVGRPDFWRLAEPEAPATSPTISVAQAPAAAVPAASEAATENSAVAQPIAEHDGAEHGGVPKAEPLADPTTARPDPTTDTGAVVPPPGPAPDADDAAKPAPIKKAAASEAKPRKKIAKKAKRIRKAASARDTSKRSRKISKRSRTISERSQAKKKAGGDDWADPYQ